MSETFNLDDFGYDASAAREHRSKKLANNVAGQWIISKAELTNSKSSGKPMIVTQWDVFHAVGDAGKVEKVGHRLYTILPTKTDDKKTAGMRTSQLQEFVQRLGLAGERPAKGSDKAAWDTYEAATKKAIEDVLGNVDTLVGKSALAKFWYKTDGTGDFVLDNAGYRQKNFTIYGNTFPANVVATDSTKFYE